MSTFLAMSLSGGALILVIAVLRALFAQRLPRRLLCALWMLALVRLLLPIFPPSPLSLFPAVESGGGEALPAAAAPTAAPQAAVSTVAPGAATLDLRAVRDASGSLTGLRVATASSTVSTTSTTKRTRAAVSSTTRTCYTTSHHTPPLRLTGSLTTELSSKTSRLPGG